MTNIFCECINLGPTEELFDLLPSLGTLLVGRVPGDASVYCCALLLAGNMRCDVQFAHVLHKVGSVIAFVGDNGDPFFPAPFLTLHHLVGSLTLGMPIGMG